MTMNLRDLQYFAVVAEHKHLGRAAEALDMSQPALSMSLRRLEAFLHSKLVKRTPKGIELTAQGEAVFAHARRLRLSVDDIAREVADINQGYTGRLRVGTSHRFGIHLLPGACTALLREAPRLMLKIALSETNRGIPALNRGELDLFITSNTLREHDDLVQETLYEEEWIVTASAKHRLAKKKQLSIADIRHEHWILGLYGPSEEELMRTLAKGGIHSPIIAAEVNSMLLRRELMIAADWLTFGPRQIFGDHAVQAGTVELAIKGLSSRRNVKAVYRKSAYLSPVARRFIELLKSTAKTAMALKR
jgi:DNA-binding transcriptional LysR family regulator